MLKISPTILKMKKNFYLACATLQTIVNIVGKMKMKISFTDHPSSVGETYFEHLFSALAFCGKLSMALCACFIHAILPFTFEKTGSRILTELMGCMVHNRDKRDQKEKKSISKTA